MIEELREGSPIFDGVENLYVDKSVDILKIFFFFLDVFKYASSCETYVLVM